MSEAATVMMTLIVSEESLVRDRHTYTHIHTHRLGSVIFLKVCFANRN